MEAQNTVLPLPFLALPSTDSTAVCTDSAALVCACAASMQASAAWLRPFLHRALGQSGLNVSQGGTSSDFDASAVIDDACTLTDLPNATAEAVEVADSCARRLFEIGGGRRIIEVLLATEVRGTGGYDSRAREAFMRVLSALQLPPRVLYDAERVLSAELGAELELAERMASEKASSKSRRSVSERSDVGGTEDTGRSSRGERFGGLLRRRTRSDRSEADDINAAQQGDVDKDSSATNGNLQRWLKIGGATVVGSVALGVSGGLLAPAIIPALGSLGLTTAAAGISGTSATVAVGGLFGVAGGVAGANAMANRTGDVQEFLFERCLCVGELTNEGVLGNDQDIWERTDTLEGTPSEGNGSNCGMHGGQTTWNSNDATGVRGARGRCVVSSSAPEFSIPVHVRERDCGEDERKDWGKYEGYVRENSQVTISVGGVLCWEFTTSQRVAMVVPARMLFGVSFASSSKGQDGGMNPGLSTRKTEDWAYPEEEVEASGTNRKGLVKRRRYTGALVMSEPGWYTLRWRLLPGSLPVEVRCRFALVPSGIDIPAFVMQDKEEVTHSGGLAANHRAQGLSMVLLVPGLLQRGVTADDPGVIADQFCTRGGAVFALDEHSIESFALRWETQLLGEVTTILQDLVGRVAVGAAAQQSARLLAPALMGAIALPVQLVMAIRSAIDNVWARVMNRAHSAGKILAGSLTQFGRRPVTLAGYSAGAAMIFFALEDLASRGAQGLVHDVYLLGTPMSCDFQRWENVRSVVSGRLVNAYWPGDWFLEIAQRSTKDVFASVAGTTPVLHSDFALENVDLTDLRLPEKFRSHLDYARLASNIFVQLGLGNGEQRRPWPVSVEYTEPKAPVDQTSKDGFTSDPRTPSYEWSDDEPTAMPILLGHGVQNIPQGHVAERQTAQQQERGGGWEKLAVRQSSGRLPPKMTSRRTSSFGGEVSVLFSNPRKHRNAQNQLAPSRSA